VIADFTDKIVVGSEEWCSLPMLGIPVIKARVDSGAKTSALHAFNIRGFKRNGIAWVSYELHPLQHNRRVIVRCESEVVDRRTVKSSSGLGEKRYVIRTLMQLSDQSWEIEITLTNRDSMGYRMLLGRSTMQDRILVDPSAKLLCGNFLKAEVQKQYGHTSAKIEGLRIGLLASNPELYSNKRIMEAAEERGHHIRFYDIKQCYMKLDAETPEIHYRGGRILNSLDAVIPRIKPSISFYGCALVRHFESIGVISLNSSRSITSSRDKLFALQVLLQNGLDIPTTGFANSPIDTNDLIEMVDGAPLIVKLLQGTHGRVVLAETTKAAESVINAFKSVNANLLVQEYIKEANGTDINLFVVDGKVAASMQRGGSTTAVKVSLDERRLAVKAAKVLGLKVAGVTIIRSAKGPLLLEVTSTPGLEALELATGKDLAGTIISAIEKRLKWKRPLAPKPESAAVS
jgi:ribosomal protein S6--L-glutamate ligase